MMKRSLCLLFVLAAGFVHAEVKLPAIFADHLVLQRGKAVAVWGTADAGEEVSVSFAGQSKTATADKDGAWKVALDKLEASAEGRELKVKGKNEVAFKDVLVGEVWICSGQSNMGFTVNRAIDAEKEMAAANDPQLRMFHVQNTVADEPQKDVLKKAADTAWLETTPQNVGNFTAAGYFFGRELRKQLNVPIGLINTSWGGTRCEAWTSKPALEAVPTCKAIITGWDEVLKTYDGAKAKEAHDKMAKAQLEKIAKIKEANAKPGATQQPVPAGVRPFEDLNTSQHRPSVLFNAMISPLVPYTVKGAIWYQGESNQKRAVQYQTLLPTMIKDWRKHWGDDFSFYIVQLASFGNGKPSWPQPVGADDTWAELQWAQFVTAAKTPKCGLAVANDIGEEKDIHPKNKQEVGRRLALQALVKDYGKKEMLSGGPIYAGGDQVANKFVINFSNGVGLKSRDGGDLKGFIICGGDKVWKPAKAKIVEGRPSVNVWSDEVKTPAAVRYAWASWCPEANLVNKDGLPTSCFRTDKFDLSTKGVEDPFKEALPVPAPGSPKKEEVRPAVKPEAAPAKKSA
jgi:sialate O-acetylesterase